MMNILTIDNVSKLVAIIGGLIAAFKLIIELRESRKQRVRELRWKQANTARELIKEMLASKMANDATIMIEWTGRDYVILPNQIWTITFDDVREALRVGDVSFDDKEVYIRDCIDAFLFSIEMLEQAIQNELIQIGDIKFPMEYYVKTLKTNNLFNSFNAFVEEYGYSNTRAFLLRF